MQAKHHIILYTFLSLALVVAVFLTFDYGVKAREAQQVLEDGYTQRVLETQEHLQAMGLKLNKAAVAGDSLVTVTLLTGVSKQSDEVVTSLSVLPLSHVAMSDTIKFCNQLSEYSMNLALEVAAGGNLAEQDVTTLGEMENQCALLLGQFVTARDAMLAEGLKMAVSGNVFYQEAQLSARPLEQVADGDNGMDYPSMIYDGAFSDARHYGEPKALGTETIDAAKAVEIAKAYVGEERIREASQSTETAGTLACFGVALTLNDGTVLNAEVTKRGGKLLWIMPEHASFPQTLTLEECGAKAKLFLETNGYGDMEANHYQIYDGLAVINFVAVQDGVLLYPDLVKAQVRMDTGEVVGMEANNYLMNHTRRSALTPELSKAQALTGVSARLNAEDARLCVIPYRDQERLCYEVAGTYQGQEYRVYIDAKTGEEVEVLIMLRNADGEVSA
ncbi:MAG: germination protein YpeB [Eubacteriales bacterium]|nr:germination protein YpeB [Eubacteriales bacterium]